MTMPNAAPTAAPVPAGTAAAAGAPGPAPRSAPTPQARPTGQSRAKDPGAALPELHIMGSGGAAGADGSAGAITVQLDAFARQSGPDAAVQTAAGLVSLHAVYVFDAGTRDMTVAIVDQDGNLIRTIPAESVGRMIADMAKYRWR